MPAMLVLYHTENLVCSKFHYSKFNILSVMSCNSLWAGVLNNHVIGALRKVLLGRWFPIREASAHVRAVLVVSAET